MITPEMRKEYRRTVAAMAVFTLVCISGVSAAHLATRHTVALNEAIFFKRSILLAAGLDAPREAAATDALYMQRVRERQSALARGGRYFEIVDPAAPDAPGGLVFFEAGSGLWGLVEGVVGLAADGRTLTGIDFVRHGETPGLGGRIDEPAFRRQFRGLQGPVKPAPEGEASAPDQFDAITGATRTSQAVQQLVNRAIESAQAVREGRHAR